MGLKDKMTKHKDYGFLPLKLTEGNVHAIFNRCLATKESTDLTAPILFSKKHGYSEDSQSIAFDKKALAINEKFIEYLFGQVGNVHNVTNIITPNSVTKDYNGNIWTTNEVITLEFLHLGYAAHLFEPFVKLSSGSAAYYSFIKHTLSPKDPNFPAWWKAHKAEWEQ